MSALLQFTYQFHHLQCYLCKQPVILSQQKYKRCHETGENFYCPDGHPQVFTESEKQRLEKELEQEKRRREWAQNERDTYRKQRDHHERSARAYRGVITKTKKRIGNGVCPCCTRTFSNLAAHMKTKHPDFAEKVVE